MARQPNPNSGELKLKVQPWMKQLLIFRAKQEDLTINQYIRRLIVKDNQTEEITLGRAD